MEGCLYGALPFFLFFFKILFIYLFVREQESEHKQGEQQAEAEAGSLLSKEPDVGLYPRTLGSRPELKADTLPGVPVLGL